MKIDKLPENVLTNIREFIEIILYEISLQDREPMGGLLLVQILSKKFKYPSDLGKIIEKINEEKATRVIRVLSGLDLEKVDFIFKWTPENLNKLQRIRSAFDLNFSYWFDEEVSFYFLVEDLAKLKEIKEKIDKILAPNKKIILEISKERKEITQKDTGLKYAFLHPRGTNKRFEYIIKIYKKPQISGQELRGKSSFQHLSGEIKQINDELNNGLSLVDKLIVNPTKRGGYEINTKYYIKIVK